MKPANAIEIPKWKRNQTVHAATQSVEKKSDLAPSDAGIFVLLTLLLIAIGRVMGAWILSDQVKIQKAPGKYVSRTEEYQNLYAQCGPTHFLRLN